MNQELLPLQVQMCQINFIQERIIRPQGFPFYQWFYCVKGEGELIINQQRSIIRPGDGIFLLPGIGHTYQGLTDDWTVHFVGFSGEICTTLLSTLGMQESGVYHFADSNTFSRHIDILFHAYTTGDALFASKACYSFLLDISRQITYLHTAHSHFENEIIGIILSYLEKNYASCISLDTLAELVGLSKEYMCNLFKQETGKSIMTFLLSIRIGHSYILLRKFPDKKVCEIAQLCGFNSPSYFGKIFKKMAGISPEKYRKDTHHFR